MKKYTSHIVLVAIMAAFIIPQVVSAAWWKPTTWFNSWSFSASKVENVKTEEVGALNSEAVLKPMTDKSTIKNTLIVSAPTTKELTEDWSTYSVSEYQFNYPSSWKPVLVSEQSKIEPKIVKFVDTSYRTRVMLQCSIREVGYEAWNFSVESKRLDEGGKKHGVTFWAGTPINNEVQPLSIVFMYRNNFPDSWGNKEEDRKNSCELVYFGEAVVSGENIMQRIYKTVSLK